MVFKRTLNKNSLFNYIMEKCASNSVCNTKEPIRVGPSVISSLEFQKYFIQKKMFQDSSSQTNHQDQYQEVKKWVTQNQYEESTTSDMVRF